MVQTLTRIKVFGFTSNIYLFYKVCYYDVITLAIYVIYLSLKINIFTKKGLW